MTDTKYRTIKLVGGKIEDFEVSRVIGYCHNKIHCGGITKNILKKHQCISKQCRYFEKYEESPYWPRVIQSLEEKALQKQKRKNKAINEAERNAKILKKCEQIRLNAQCVANKIKVNVLITRVIPSPTDNGFKYLINYVTDIPANDWHMYIEIAEELGKIYHCKFKLRHVKFPNGRYMTIDEWKIRFLS